MLIYAVCDEDGLWHGRPDADLDSPPTTARLQVPPGCGPFAGQTLLIRAASMEEAPGPCAYPVEGRRAVYATYDVYQLLGDWDEEITDAAGHATTPSPRGNRADEAAINKSATSEPSVQVTHHLETSGGSFSITLGRIDTVGRSIEIDVLGGDQHGECCAQLAGTVDLAALAGLGRALQALAEKLPGTTTSTPPATSPPPAASVPRRRPGQQWSEQDHDHLRQRARAGAPAGEIARELGRTELAVLWKLWTFGLGARPDPAPRAPHQPVKPEPAYTFEDLRQVHLNSHQRWTEEEEQRLIARTGQGASISDLVTEFGRNERAITSRLARLGVYDLDPQSAIAPK